MDLPLDYLAIFATTQAGFYALKFFGYKYLKSADSGLREGDVVFGQEIPRGLTERKDLTLRFFRRGAILPTPLDFAYWVGNAKSFFGGILERTYDEPVSSESQTSRPFSKAPRILEFVDENLEPASTRPYKKGPRRIELVHLS